METGRMEGGRTRGGVGGWGGRLQPHRSDTQAHPPLSTAYFNIQLHQTRTQKKLNNRNIQKLKGKK